MLAIAQSPYNTHFQQVTADIFYIDASGYADLTDYGEWVSMHAGQDFLYIFLPDQRVFTLTDMETELILWVMGFQDKPEPPPPEQLTLFTF